MSDEQNRDDEWRKTMPGGNESDDPLGTPKHIRNATLDELRRDERIWAAYERGWCDFIQAYISAQLMQSEMPFLYPNMLSVDPPFPMMLPTNGEVAPRENRGTERSPDRMKRTDKYDDVRKCEFEKPVQAQLSDGPQRTGEKDPKLEDSMIRIKITSPDSTEFELNDSDLDGDDNTSGFYSE